MFCITIYLRFFFVNTLDILFNTYYYCYDTCHYFLNKEDLNGPRPGSPDLNMYTNLRYPTPPPIYFETTFDKKDIRYPTPPFFLSTTNDRNTPSPPPFILDIHVI